MVCLAGYSFQHETLKTFSKNHNSAAKIYMNQKPQIGKLYNLSRKTEQSVYVFSDRECGDYPSAKKLWPDNIIVLVSDRFTVSWGGNVYKILTESGNIRYVVESVGIRELCFYPVKK